MVVSTHPAIFLASAALLLLMVALLLFSIAALILLVASNLTLTPEPIAGGCQFEYQSGGGSGALKYALLVAFLYWSVQLCMTVRFYVRRRDTNPASRRPPFERGRAGRVSGGSPRRVMRDPRATPSPLQPRLWGGRSDAARRRTAPRPCAGNSMSIEGE